MHRSRTSHFLHRLANVAHSRAGKRVWTLLAATLVLSAIMVSLLRYEVLNAAIGAIRIDTPNDKKMIENDNNAAIRSAATVPPGIANTAQIETRHSYVAGRIETSLFEDGQQAGLSDALILKLIEIFGWDIDFALGVKRGDSFAVIHEEKYWMGQKIGDGPILVAEFVNRGKSHHAIGHKDKTGVTAYYELDGMSKKKTFLRTPIEFSRISSRYTDKATRFHPILKIWTAHHGIDYAAPTGTPIRATAAGRVLSMEVNGGYGKMIEIRHDAAYNTVYAHLSKFAPTIRAGSYAEQGQIIGYVGQTGLATGPHLHYEFHVRHVHRDPLQFKFSGTPIPVQERQAFFAQAQLLIAKLERITDRHLAINR